ncbi:MAG: FAD:protein FMN transferase, partial [Eubacteriales bacterium]|nr:FAD:protein FMN transferase [Eubacteriales bacterium]
MKRRLTCAVLALCLLLSGCAATGTTSHQRYSVTWWDVFDTVTVISGYADSEADWNTQMTALHVDLLRYNQLYDIYNHYDGMTNLADVNAGAAAAPVAVGDEIM